MSRVKHQDGWVEKTGKQKIWRGHFYTYDEAGKRHHRTTNLGPCKDRAKHEAEAALRIIVERETHQPTRTSGQDTVQWYWENRFVPAQDWGTLMYENLDYCMKRFIFPKIGSQKLNAIDQVQLVTIFKGLAQYSHSMNAKLRTYLKAMFEHALDLELIRKNPMKRVKNFSRKKAIKRFLKVEEVHALLAQLEPRDRIICMVAITLGLRPAELFALKWNNFDPSHCRVLIQETFCQGEWKPTKTEGSKVWMPIPPALVDQLMAWKETQVIRGELIFPGRGGIKPITYGNYLTTIIRPAAIRAGIMQPKPKEWPAHKPWSNKATAVNFQVMRRTLATWAKEDADLKAAQSLMRHEDSGMTQRHYVGEVEGSGVRVQEKIFQRLFQSTFVPAKTTRTM